MFLPRTPRHAALAAALLLVAFAPAARASWPESGLPVCTAGATQYEPRIVTDGSGGAIVVWLDARYGRNNLYAQRVDSSGVVRWSANGVAVCTDASSQSSHVLVPYSGGAVVYWQDSRNGNHDIYGQRLSDQGVPLWAFNGVPIATGPDDQERPKVIPDFASPTFTTPGQIVLWGRRDPLQTSVVTPCLQRVGAGGSLIWTTLETGVGLVAQPATRYDWSMATDGTGASVLGPKGAVVVWAEVEGLTGYDIRARRISYAGIPQWAADGVPVCTLPDAQTVPVIAAVGSGSTVIAWLDSRNVDADVYAQKLGLDGAPQWAADGVPICRAPTNQSSPRIVSDGVGGAILAWIDSRANGSGAWAQRVDASGQRLWALDGVAVCPGASQQRQIELVSDGAGGAIVVWADSVNGGDLIAQRLGPDGSLLWPVAGVRLTTGADRYGAISTVGDGAFGVLAAWADDRGTGRDIYAMRLPGGAAFLDVPPGPSAGAVALAPPAPNPALGETTVRYALPGATSVSLALFDVSGRLVRRLARGESAAGEHVVRVPLADERGQRLAPGVYVVRLECEGRSLARRIVALR